MSQSELLNVSPELLERLAVSGPRYTSYPTAPEWSDEAAGRPGYILSLGHGVLKETDPELVVAREPGSAGVPPAPDAGKMPALPGGQRG